MAVAKLKRATAARNITEKMPLIHLSLLAGKIGLVAGLKSLTGDVKAGGAI